MNNYAVYSGLSVVVATHIWMLNEAMPESMRKYHAFVNLGASGLILYGVM
jgi:hypothetical protein